MPAVTMADMAAAEQVDLKRGTLEILANEFPLSDILPIQNLGGAVSTKYAQINPDDQPTVGLRNVGSAGVFTRGSMETKSESIQLFHEAVQIDAVIQGDKTYLYPPGPTEVEFASKQLTRKMLDTLFNGDPTVQYGTDGNSKPTFRPAGLRYRIANAANYGFDSGVYTNGITGATLDLTSITATVANNVVDSISELQELTDANVIAMNFRMKTLFTKSLRLGGLLKTTEDQYGRKFDTLFGMRIVVPKLATAARNERNLADTTNWILPWEDANGNTTPTASAGSRYGSAFLMKTATDAVSGITNSGLFMEGPIKLLPPNRAFAYQMEFGLGFMTIGFKPCAQLYGFKLG